MKYIVISLFLFVGINFCIAQKLSNNNFYYTNSEQIRIDTMDGKLDGIVQMNNEEATRKATNIYVNLIDSIEQHILNNSFYTEQEKFNVMGYLNIPLKGISERNIYLLSYYEKVFSTLFKITSAKDYKELELELFKNIYASTQTIPFYKNTPIAYNFLIEACKTYPDEVLKHYGDFADQVWAKNVIVETAKIAPLSVKKYLNGNHPIKMILYSSNDTIIQLICQINERYGMKTNAYVLIDGIFNNFLTIDKADSVSKVDTRYLMYMLRIRRNAQPLAKYSLDKELEFVSLKFVRAINELHDVADPKVRFAISDELTPPELYTLMVYSEDEIFTSTFLGLFNRMLTRMYAQKGNELLDQVGYNKFRTFIKLCAGFNTLDKFLMTMDPAARDIMLQNFVQGLEKDRGNLTAPVEVADAFGSIKDSSSLAVIEYALIKEYARVEYNQNKEGLTIYGLLMTLFTNKAVNQKVFFEKIASKYELPIIDKVSYSNMISKDTQNLQLHFFFDDDDGKASFRTYIETFTTAGWIITKHEKFVEITSKNNRVKILANFPESEEIGGQEELINYCNEKGVSPQIIVHRGHSYYAMKTIDKVTASAKIVFLGSCGGYNNLNEIIDRSPDVQIIATKQIGTMFVNNPLLLQLANNISSGKDIDWVLFWSQLEKTVKPNKAAYERFEDYIPPYKNLGAIFIQAYRKALSK